MRVSFDVPREVDLNYLKEFIRTALQSMGGCRHPDDPLFHSLDNVTATLIRKSKPK
jgi:hypothetical protein